MDCQNLWCCGSISPKTIFIFPKNFLNFRFDEVEWQSIVNLSRYLSKGYTSVFHGHSEVTFFVKKEDAALCPSIYCVLVQYGIAESEGVRAKNLEATLLFEDFS